MCHVTVLNKTRKAIQLCRDDGVEFWVPNSVIGENSEVWEQSKIGDTGELYVHAWFLEKNSRG